MFRYEVPFKQISGDCFSGQSYIWSKFCFKVKHYSKYDPAGFLLHFTTFLKTSGKKSLRPTLAGYEEGSQGGELF